LKSAGVTPAGWFLPWNEYHGYQQVAEQFNAEPDLVPLFGVDALMYLDGETRALLSGERAVLPQTKQHAEALYTVAAACLKTYGVDVERVETSLYSVIADIRQATGLGARPMLSDLAAEIGKMRAQRDALNEALRWFVDREAPIKAKFALHGPKDTADAMVEAFAAARTAIGQVPHDR